MKFFIVAVFTCILIQAHAISASPDNIQEILRTKNTRSKVDSILAYYRVYHLPRIDDSIDVSIKYCQYAFDISNTINYPQGLMHSSFELGYLYTNQGNYNQAIRYHFISLKTAEKTLESKTCNEKDTNMLISNLKYLGILFLMQKNYPVAYDYFTRLLLIQPHKNETRYSIFYLLAFCELKLHKLETVEKNIYKSMSNVSDSSKIFQSKTLLASLYRQQKKFQESEEILLSALNYFNAPSPENRNNNTRAFIYEELARIQLEKGYVNKAIQLATNGYQLAKNDPREFNLYELSELLYTLHYQSGNVREAYRYLLHNKQLNDSLHKNDVSTTIALAFAENESEKKEIKLHAEIIKREKNQLLAWSIVGLAILFFVILMRFYNEVRKERRKSESLLHNILPEEVSTELKINGKVKARYHEEATILFADFVNFSTASMELKPEELVSILDEYFTEFDHLVEKYGLEKIKTIGDAYMVVGGLHARDKSFIQNTALLALDMLHYVKSHNQFFEVRIGIHCGPLVSGVVGRSKFAYDVWGKSVNMAARMESSSIPQHINITREFYEKLGHAFVCEYRGTIEMKNTGSTESYFLIRKT